MTRYLALDTDSVIVGALECPEKPDDQSELHYVSYDGPISTEELVFGDTIYVYSKGSVINTNADSYPKQEGLVWNARLRNWVDGRTIEELRAAKWEEIKANREAAEYGTLQYQGKCFDIDSESQQRILSAAQLGMLRPNLERQWTLSDNTTVVLTAADLINLAELLADHVETCHRLSQAIRTQVEAAQDPHELSLINWP